MKVSQDNPGEESMTPARAVARAMSTLHAGICIPDYEALLVGGYRRFLEPGSIVVDVGANLGFHTGHLAGYGRVIGFEPIPEHAANLRSVFADRPNVEIREVALGRTTGEQTFYHFPVGHGMSGLQRRSDRTDTAREIQVHIDTLDNQLGDLDQLNYVKIDIEGGEIDCLLGGRETIMRHRPYISVEYGHLGYAPYRYARETLFLVASDFGYVISDLFGNVIETRKEWANICDFSYWDYFLLPEEKRQFWRAAFWKTQPGVSDR